MSGAARSCGGLPKPAGEKKAPGKVGSQGGKGHHPFPGAIGRSRLIEGRRRRLAPRLSAVSSACLPRGARSPIAGAIECSACRCIRSVPAWHPCRQHGFAGPQKPQAVSRGRPIHLWITLDLLRRCEGGSWRPFHLSWREDMRIAGAGQGRFSTFFPAKSISPGGRPKRLAPRRRRDHRRRRSHGAPRLRFAWLRGGFSLG